MRRRTNLGTTKITCAACGKWFLRQYAADAHRETCSALRLSMMTESAFVCQLCLRTFSTQEEREAHQAEIEHQQKQREARRHRHEAPRGDRDRTRATEVQDLCEMPELTESRGWWRTPRARRRGRTRYTRTRPVLAARLRGDESLTHVCKSNITLTTANGGAAGAGEPTGNKRSTVSHVEKLAAPPTRSMT